MIDSRFSGFVGKYHNRVGEGVQKFITKKGNETYNGPLVNDKYHGYGQYIATNVFGESWSYEGMFYANNFHGYGNMSYADGSIYSGLYKMGKQFGPGVLTYPDGRQDVGLWHGSQLLRLCVTAGSVEKLCTNAYNKVQIVHLKKMITIPRKNACKSVAKEIMEGITSDAQLISQSYKLYSRHSSEPESYLFDEGLFNDFSNKRLTDLEFVFGVYDETDPTAIANADAFILDDVVQPELQDEEDSRIPEDEGEVYMVSWNNQKIVINLMVHAFQFRRQECVTDYGMGEILCHRRNAFAEHGQKEAGCLQMMKASSRDDSKTILGLLTKLRLNPDVMDNYGNSMIIMAAECNAIKVIKMLAEIGANINSVNDEGFNAINYTLTKYLALEHGISDWGTGFLPANGRNADCPFEWMTDCAPHTSKKKTLNSGFIKKKTVAKYLFDVSPMVPSSRKKGSPVKSDHTASEDLQLISELERIETTFKSLLDVNVDVNGSMTPQAALILGIFTQMVNIVEEILKHGADPNLRVDIDDGNLTALHVLTLLKPMRANSQLIEVLVYYGAISSLRTTKMYRRQYWRELLYLGKGNFYPEGLTPLHTLILRPDAEILPQKKYLLDMACLLSWHSGTEFFLGLNPVGLAIFRKNLDMVAALIACSYMDINEKFDEYWGNSLTTYLIMHGTSSGAVVNQLLNLLLQCGADPLTYREFRHKGNVLNIANAMLSRFHFKKLSVGSIRVPSDSSRRSGSVKDKSTSGRQSSVSVPRKDGPRRRSHKQSLKSAEYYLSQFRSMEKKYNELSSKIDILKNVAKNKLENYIKGVLVRALLHCIQKALKEDYTVGELFPKVLKYFRDWVDPSEFPFILSSNMQESEFSKGTALLGGLLLLINFSNTFKKEAHMDQQNVKEFLESLQTPKKIRQSVTIPVKFEHKKAQDIMASVKEAKEKLYVPPECSKDGKLFKVCYSCLQRSKNNRLCPKCELVYFCSGACNFRDATDENSKHKCRLIFWGLKSSEAFVHEKEIVSLKHSSKGSREHQVAGEGGGGDFRHAISFMKRSKRFTHSSPKEAGRSVRIPDEGTADKDLKMKESSTKQKSLKTEKSALKGIRDRLQKKGIEWEKGVNKKGRKREEEGRISNKGRISTKGRIGTKRRISMRGKRGSKGSMSKTARGVRLSQSAIKSKMGYGKTKGVNISLKKGSRMTVRPGSMFRSPGSRRFTSKVKRGTMSMRSRSRLSRRTMKTKGSSSTTSRSGGSSTSKGTGGKRRRKGRGSSKARVLDTWKESGGKKRRPSYGTQCPPVLYGVLGRRSLEEQLWLEHDLGYNIRLKDRLKAVLERLNLDISDLLPFLVFVPHFGLVCYKNYKDLIENYSYN